MRSVFAALVLLSVLTAGAAQARPLAPLPAPARAFQELWQWVVSGLAPVFTRDGSGMDPNGQKPQAVKPDDASGNLTGGAVYKPRRER